MNRENKYNPEAEDYKDLETGKSTREDNTTKEEIKKIDNLDGGIKEKFSGDKDLSKKNENKPENEDIVDEKLSYLEDRMYSVKNKIETSYKETSSVNNEVGDKLSSFGLKSENEYGDKLKYVTEDFKDNIHSFFRTKTREKDNLQERIARVIGEYEGLKKNENVSKEKRLEINRKMLIDLKKINDEYQEDLNRTQSFLKQKLEDHTNLIKGVARKSEDDPKKTEAIKEYNFRFNSLNNGLKEIFSKQKSKTNRVSSEIYDELTRISSHFEEIIKRNKESGKQEKK